MKKRKSNLGNPTDDLDAIIQVADEDIQKPQSPLALRRGAETLYLALASSLEKLAGREIKSAHEQRAVLARLGRYNKKLPRIFTDLKTRLHGECFHEARCSVKTLLEAKGSVETFIRALPPKLP